MTLLCISSMTQLCISSMTLPCNSLMTQLCNYLSYTTNHCNPLHTIPLIISLVDAALHLTAYSHTIYMHTCFHANMHPSSHAHTASRLTPWAAASPASSWRSLGPSVLQVLMLNGEDYYTEYQATIIVYIYTHSYYHHTYITQ